VWYILQKEIEKHNLDLPEETVNHFAKLFGDLFEREHSCLIKALREKEKWAKLEEVNE